MTVPEHLAVLFGRIAPVVVPRDRSIDIDDAQDLLVVETLLASRAGASDSEDRGAGAHG